jgi:protein-tyrosine phosphatase
MYGWDGFYDDFTTEPHKVFSMPSTGGELWQGGTPNSLKQYDVVVGMEHEPTDRVYARVKFEGIHIWHPINDWEVVDGHALRSIAAFVADRIEIGDRVLVHCSAGLNRSGVVNARALMWLGYTADEAIAMLRKNRYQSVLCNPKFVKWLKEEQENFGIEAKRAS